jgi:membrane-bound lytic murein transglycosylase A-like protein
MQKKQLSVLVLIILCFLLGCNRETPKDESQQNYEDESNISKTNGEELVNINSELLGSTPFDIIAQRRGFCYPYPRSVPFSRSGCLSACKMLSMFCLIISYSRTFFFSFP